MTRTCAAVVIGSFSYAALIFGDSNLYILDMTSISSIERGKETFEIEKEFSMKDNLFIIYIVIFLINKVLIY